MADLPLTKLQVDLPNHGGVGGESMWARVEGSFDAAPDDAGDD